jgi:DNA-binding NarL/FixJ family response regulator
MALFAESLRLRHDPGDLVGTAEELENMAGLAATQQAQPDRAGQLAGAAAALRQSFRAPLSPMRRGIVERWLVPLRQAVGGDTVDRAAARERDMPLDDAVALALVGTEPSAVTSSRLVSSPEARGPLTNREHEVAALLAQGLSNREIAARLVITERTVAAHVEHILNKLGFASRTQIGVWAADHGLRQPSGNA